MYQRMNPHKAAPELQKPMYALSQPPHVDVNEVLVRPTAQPQ